MKKQDKIRSLLHEPTKSYEVFHEQTKNLRGKHSEEKKIPISWRKNYFKGYARMPEIILPSPSLSPSYSLEHALKKRQTTYSFSKKPLTKKALSTLLYYAAGIHEAKDPSSHRFYPASGARYPLEVYVLSLNTSLPKGMYHYYVKNHSLEKLADMSSFDSTKYFAQSFLKDAACILFISAVFGRNTVKYGDRGYRYMLIEAGHLVQNIYLLAPSLRLSIAAIGGFYDDEVNKLLDLEPLKESVLYTVAIG